MGEQAQRTSLDDSMEAEGVGARHAADGVDVEGARPRRHFTLLRSFSLADFVTLGNAACGMSAALLCVRYSETREAAAMWSALGLLPIALVLDVLDGFIARARRRSSPYGGDLDSLADIVSFGVAPALVGYTLGLRGGWDVIFLVYFVCCGIGRLARFNVTAESLATESGKVSHFEGTPIPTSLVLVLVLGLAFALGAVHESLWFGELSLFWKFHPLSLLYAVSGTLMVTATLKIPKP